MAAVYADWRGDDFVALAIERVRGMRWGVANDIRVRRVVPLVCVVLGGLDFIGTAWLREEKVHGVKEEVYGAPRFWGGSMYLSLSKK